MSEFVIPRTWSILCDFDGTISRQDVVDSLLHRFGAAGWEELETKWTEGRIGSRACLSGQVALLEMHAQELSDQLDTITLDPGFADFLAAARARGMTVEILSDGLSQAIAHVLARHGIEPLPVYANQLMAQPDGSWQLATPYTTADCASAHCKCSQLTRHKHGVLFIGDGTSDFCIAGRADFVLAKGRLARYCEAQGMAYAEIEDFADALRFLAPIEHDVAL